MFGARCSSQANATAVGVPARARAAPAGSRLHACAEAGIPLRDIAEVIGRLLDLPVVNISRADADAHFGFLGRFVRADDPTSSALTQRLLAWRPTHPDLIEDLDEGHYFRDLQGR